MTHRSRFMPDDLVVRYCPKCGARVKATEPAFLKPRKCPKCEHLVTFYDYWNDVRDAVATSPPTADTDWFDYALYASFAATPLFLLIATICILFGIGDWALFGGGVCLVLALPLWVRFAQLHASLIRIRRERDALRENETKLRHSVMESGELASGFRRNFDSLLLDHKHEQEKRYSRAEAMFAAADEKQRVVDAMADRFLKDTVTNISSKLTVNNFTSSSDRLRKAIDFCRKSRFPVPKEWEEGCKMI